MLTVALGVEMSVDADADADFDADVAADQKVRHSCTAAKMYESLQLFTTARTIYGVHYRGLVQASFDRHNADRLHCHTL